MPLQVDRSHHDLFLGVLQHVQRHGPEAVGACRPSGSWQPSAAAPAGELNGRPGAPCRSSAATLSPAMSLQPGSPSLSLTLTNQGMATELPERPSEVGEGTLEVTARGRSADNLGPHPSSNLRPPAAAVVARSAGSRDAAPDPPAATSGRPAGVGGGTSSHGASRRADPFADAATAAQSALGSSKALPGPLQTLQLGSSAAVDGTGLAPEEVPPLSQSPSLQHPGAPQALQAWPSRAARQPQGISRITSSAGWSPPRARRQSGHGARVSANGTSVAAP